MTPSRLSFELPSQLIAQYPAARRDAARLLVVDRATDRLIDAHISDLPRWVPRTALLVCNDSRVRSARLQAQRAGGGGRVEVLLCEPLSGNRWRAKLNRLRRQRVGQRYHFAAGVSATLEQRDAEGAVLAFHAPLDEAWLQRHGRVPLPPYIRRLPRRSDRRRYQTIYATHAGSVAAPTAGLHFTPRLLRRLRSEGRAVAYITLHVGPGTFDPLRTDDPAQHRMHTERLHISDDNAQRIDAAHRQGQPILAVGTTSVRTLESAWQERSGHLRRGPQVTDLFIRPPWRFHLVDHLLTNLHAPDSTLLLLVCAFGGSERILHAYRYAVEHGYRFLSYGDAMLIL